MTLLIGTVFSIFTPMMQYFRFLFLIPVMAVVIGKNKVIAGGFLIFSLVYLLNKNMWREDWKTLVSHLNGPVYMVSSFNDPVNYYNPDIKIYDIRNTTRLSDGQVYESKITVIPYGEAIHGVDHNQILTKAGYRKTAETDYREIGVEIWQKI